MSGSCSHLRKAQCNVQNCKWVKNAGCRTRDYTSKTNLIGTGGQTPPPVTIKTDKELQAPVGKDKLQQHPLQNKQGKSKKTQGKRSWISRAVQASAGWVPYVPYMLGIGYSAYQAMQILKSSSSSSSSSGEKTHKYYDIMDIPRNASLTQVKQAYRKKALSAHPDKGGDTKTFQNLSEAYSVLSNPELRQFYNAYGNKDFKKRVHRR